MKECNIVSDFKCNIHLVLPVFLLGLQQFVLSYCLLGLVIVSSSLRVLLAPCSLWVYLTSCF
jgi:hypothetical protein